MGVGYWYFPINESLLYFLGDKFISLLLINLINFRKTSMLLFFADIKMA